VQKVTVATKTQDLDYTLDPATGTITELIEFGAGKPVIVTYTSDFVLPASYPLALNASPDMGEDWAEWTAKPVVDGTYSVNIWGSRPLSLNLYGESNSYRGTSLGKKADFLVGSATQVEPYSLISSGQNCNACHTEVMFHGGGRRGFETCVMCHGTAGSEDRPQYVAANAPPTPLTTVNFRTMLHKIHMGEELANASSWTVVGYGSGSWPNNFTPHTYGEVVFPALPQGVKNCEKCHGAGNTAWMEPSDRNHPTVQGLPAREWRAVCGSCHDSNAAGAHVDLMTSASGVESCSICHQPGKEWNVPKMHKSY
jgi:OmcA/MtrC family decaheme c-type cytochrome